MSVASFRASSKRSASASPQAIGQSDLALTSHEFIGKLALPFEQGEEIASLYQSHGAIVDPADRTIRSAGCNRVLNRLGPQFVGGIPKSGTSVQLGNFNAAVRLQPLSQIFGEQRMIAKPDAVIDRAA